MKYTTQRCQKLEFLQVQNQNLNEESLMVTETTRLYSDLQGRGRLFPVSHLLTELDNTSYFTGTMCPLPGTQVDTIQIPQEEYLPPT